MSRSTLLSGACLLCLMLTGCAWPESRGTAGALTAQQMDRGQRAAQLAQQQVGVPYEYGGRTPRGFDCSGLVYYVYGRLGVDLPRTAGAQYDHTRRVALADLRPGDLVFFLGADHVGIYVGDGWFIHAPETGKPVGGAWLNTGYWHDNYYGAGRP